MKTERDVMPRSEAREQVNLALRRAALLYHHFADTLINRSQIIDKALWG